MSRLSTRAALACGLLVTLGLWLYTGYTFSRRFDQVEKDAAAVASRYLRAQELLATVRTQILVASVRVRDALLNPDTAALGAYREQVSANYAAIDAALTAYVPVLGSDREHGEVARLRREVADFQRTVAGVLDGRSERSTREVRELLNSHIVPRREAAVLISEQVQALNRAAFLQQQAEFAAIHRQAEAQSARRLLIGLALSAAVLLVVGAYAGGLERRLRAQLARDARLSTELRETHAKLIQAQEQERQTIARELHDEVGQVLTAVKFELGLAQRALEARGVESAPLGDAQAITATAIRAVRDLTYLLHPAALDDLGLGPAVEALLNGLARRHDVRVSLSQFGMARRLESTTEVAAYRIVQEALTNVARHARATACEVELRCSDEMLTLLVSDDGVGFAAGDEPPGSSHLGLRGIRERAAALGGTFEVTSRPGRGTRIRVELPLAPAAAAHRA
jgi:signal transduction histidine kinase